MDRIRTVLCYGDSNTWGYDPDFTAEGEYRLPAESRWPRLLGQTLGGCADVIEEGLGGRTTVFEDAVWPGRNGRAMLAPVLQSHQPLDLVVFMLGTNDAKVVYSAPVPEIAAGMEALLKIALDRWLYDNRTPPKVLIISPILISGDVTNKIFDESSIEKTKELAGAYAALAQNYGCAFLDAARHASPSPKDGVHLDAAGHRALARAVAGKVRQLLANNEDCA